MPLRRMPHWISPLALLGLLLLLFVAPARADYSQEFHFDAQELRVTNLIGEITVEGHDGSGFEVEVHVRGEDATDGTVTFEREDGRESDFHIVFPVDEEDRYVYPEMGRRSRTTFRSKRGDSWYDRLGGNRIEVRGSGKGMEVWADVFIHVPKGGEIEILHGVGAMVATNIEGRVSLAVRSGRIEALDIVGPLEADTGSGHVEVENIQGALAIDTGSGHVEAVVIEGDRVHIDTGSGHVRLSDARADEVEIDTGSGGVDLRGVVCHELTVDTGSGGVEADDVEADQAMIDTGSGSVRVQLVRMGEGRFEVDTGSGTITFEMPDDPSAYVEASTGSGGIDVDVADAVMHRKKRDEVEFEVGSGSAQVSLETGSGGIRVRSR